MSKKRRKRAKPPAQPVPAAKPPAKPPAQAAPPLPEASRAPVHEFVIGLLLALFIPARACVDGVTYPALNSWFSLVIFAIAAVWGFAALMQPRPFRAPWLVAAYLALLGAILLSFTTTIQYDATYRGLVQWTSYGLLFLVAANAFTSDAARRVVLASLVFTLLAESAYALIQIEFILPQQRLMMLQDPAMAGQFFGQAEMTGDLENRVFSNRAFGTFLFPNALAAFCALAVPVAAGGIFGAWRTWKECRAEGADAAAAPPEPFGLDRNLWSVIFAGLLWLLLFVIAFFVYPIILTFMFLGDTALSGPAAWTGWAVCVVILPVIIVAPVFITTRRHGLRTSAALVWLASNLAATLVGLFTLASTYSRGGMLALGLAVAAGALLLLAWRRRNLKLAAAAAVALLSAANAATMAGPASAQDAGEMRSAAGYTVAGHSPTLEQLTDPMTLGMRLGYWRVGMRMLEDHPWTGVGLGNFGAAYPKYKTAAEESVKQAHNDYIQMLTETGIIGGVLFVLFWGGFVVAGALRILVEARRERMLVMLGLYSGVLALLLHSLVDFNFANPSLASFGFATAGLFVSYGWSAAPVWASLMKRGLVAVGVLLVAAGAGGAAMQLGWADRVAGVNGLTQRLQASQVLLDLAAAGPRAAANSPVTVSTAALILPEMDDVNELGTVYTRVGQGMRPVPRGEPLDPDQMLVVNRPDATRELVEQGIRAQIARLERADQIYGHNPVVAEGLYLWHLKLLEQARDRQQQRRLSGEVLEWARETMERSPEQAQYHQALAEALWRRGNTERGPQASEYFAEGMTHWRKAVALNPSSWQTWRDFGQALANYGTSMVVAARRFDRPRDEEDGWDYVNEAMKAWQEARRLRPDNDWRALLDMGTVMVEFGEELWTLQRWRDSAMLRIRGRWDWIMARNIMPTRPEAWQEMGRAIEGIGRRIQTLEITERAGIYLEEGRLIQLEAAALARFLGEREGNPTGAAP